MTPSQQAKDFAAANGFIIEPVGRRYRIARNGQANVTIAEVGGYPAALNAMKAQVSADEITACTEPAPDTTEWRTKSPDEIRADLIAGIEALKNAPPPRDIVRELQLGSGATLDALAREFGMQQRRYGETDVSYRYYLMFSYRESDVGTTPKVDDRQIFDGAVKRISQPATHLVVFKYRNGVEQELGYPSYRDAVKGVRQVLSGLHKRYHPSYVNIVPVKGACNA